MKKNDSCLNGKYWNVTRHIVNQQTHFQNLYVPWRQKHQSYIDTATDVKLCTFSNFFDGCWRLIKRKEFHRATSRTQGIHVSSVRELPTLFNFDWCTGRVGTGIYTSKWRLTPFSWLIHDSFFSRGPVRCPLCPFGLWQVCYYELHLLNDGQITKI